jgi:hypothetical protein
MQKFTCLSTIRRQSIQFYWYDRKGGEYYKLIKKIEEHRSGDESLWMQIEDIFNSLAKKHFLSERNDEELYVALDDDRHHFNYSKHANTYMD